MRSALWFKTAMNRDVNTGPFARPFACTAHSFTCSALLQLLARSPALNCSPTHSRARGKVNVSMFQNDLVLSYSVTAFVPSSFISFHLSSSSFSSSFVVFFSLFPSLPLLLFFSSYAFFLFTSFFSFALFSLSIFPPIFPVLSSFAFVFLVINLTLFFRLLGFRLIALSPRQRRSPIATAIAITMATMITIATVRFGGRHHHLHSNDSCCYFCHYYIAITIASFCPHRSPFPPSLHYTLFPPLLFSSFTQLDPLIFFPSFLSTFQSFFPCKRSCLFNVPPT